MDKGNEWSLASTLADELTIALRAAGWASGVRWGTRILGLGAVLAVWAWGRDAVAAGTIVIIALTTSFSVGVAATLTRGMRAPRETRSRALLAARRLESRFPERSGVLVAAVDFCCGGAAGEEAATSADLRQETIASATRFLASRGSEIDAVDWRASLAGEKCECFRDLRKKTGIFALGVLVNLAVGGSAVVWELNVRGNSETFSPSAPTLRGVEPIDKSKRNGEDRREGGNVKNKEETTVEESGVNEETRVDEINVASETDELLRDGEILAALEVLIFELVQNAEIAELLKTELENAVDAERASAAADDATQFLLSARELSVNLTKPNVGILAQTRRLEATLRREPIGVETLDEKTKRIEEIDGVKKIVDMSELGKNAAKASGPKVALFLLTRRLSDFETECRVWKTQELERSFGLSVAARNASAAARTSTLETAARRVGEWATTLRREATAARILSESWVFYETSQSWEAAKDEALQKNRNLLARFAGRLAFGAAAIDERDAAFEETKERFIAAWNETRRLEKERFAIFNRLQKRLQNEDAKEFCKAISEEFDGSFADDLLGNADRDAAIFASINDAARRAEERDFRITEELVNNRFGRVAEELQRQKNRPESDWATLRRMNEADEENETALKKDDDLSDTRLSDANKENAFESERSDEERSLARREDERRAFLAARLTFGVGDALQYGTLQAVENNKLAFDVGEVGDKATARRANGEETPSVGASRQEKEARTSTTNNENDATALKSAKRQVAAGIDEGAENNNDAANFEKENGCDSNSQDGEEARGELKVKRPSLGGAEKGDQKNGDANAGEASGAGAGGAFEKTEETVQPDLNQSFNGELPPEFRRRFEQTRAPEIVPEYAEKIRLYRRRITREKR